MKDVVTNITNSSTLCTRKLIICMLFCVSLRLTYVADRSLAGILWWLSYRLATTSWSPLHSTVIPKTNTHTHIDVLCYEVWRFLESRVLKLVTFTVPCIVSIFQYISNKMQHYTVYCIWKLLYRLHRYSCTRSWWWIEVPLETRRAVSR